MLCKKPYKVKGFGHNVRDAFICKVMQQAPLNYGKYGVQCSVEENRLKTDLKKRLNSQTKFLFVRLWDYFKQEARKSKVSQGIETESRSYTTISFAAGFGIHSAT